MKDWLGPRSLVLIAEMPLSLPFVLSTALAKFSPSVQPEDGHLTLTLLSDPTVIFWIGA